MHGQQKGRHNDSVLLQEAYMRKAVGGKEKWKLVAPKREKGKLGSLEREKEKDGAPFAIQFH